MKDKVNQLYLYPDILDGLELIQPGISRLPPSKPTTAPLTLQSAIYKSPLIQSRHHHDILPRLHSLLTLFLHHLCLSHSSEGKTFNKIQYFPNFSFPGSKSSAGAGYRVEGGDGPPPGGAGGAPLLHPQGCCPCWKEVEALCSLALCFSIQLSEFTCVLH